VGAHDLAVEVDLRGGLADEFAVGLHLREISLRTVIKTADLRKAFPGKWRALASTTLMKSEA
jgi:hypothetical protein